MAKLTTKRRKGKKLQVLVPFPPQILQELKCYYCEKHVTCGPVCLTHGSIMCGRCHSLNRTHRNHAFEAIASLFYYPCRYFSKHCNENLKWNQSLEHKKDCIYKNRWKILLNQPKVLLKWRRSLQSSRNIQVPHLPPEVLKRLRCKICKNFLSASPVYINAAGENLCHRCAFIARRNNAITNPYYEMVAKMMTFPCKNRSRGCSIAIKFGEDMVKHEEECAYAKKRIKRKKKLTEQAEEKKSATEENNEKKKIVKEEKKEKLCKKLHENPGLFDIPNLRSKEKRTTIAGKEGELAKGKQKTDRKEKIKRVIPLEKKEKKLKLTPKNFFSQSIESGCLSKKEKKKPKIKAKAKKEKINLIKEINLPDSENVKTENIKQNRIKTYPLVESPQVPKMWKETKKKCERKKNQLSESKQNQLLCHQEEDKSMPQRNFEAQNYFSNKPLLVFNQFTSIQENVLINFEDRRTEQISFDHKHDKYNNKVYICDEVYRESKYKSKKNNIEEDTEDEWEDYNEDDTDDDGVKNTGDYREEMYYSEALDKDVEEETSIEYYDEENDVDYEDFEEEVSYEENSDGDGTEDDVDYYDKSEDISYKNVEQEEEDNDDENFQVEINYHNKEDEDDYENDKEEEYVVEESSDESDIEDAIGYCDEDIKTEEQDDDEDSSVDVEEEDEQEEEDIEDVNFQVKINNYNDEDEDDFENGEEEEYVVEESSDESDIEDAIGYCNEDIKTEEQDDDEDSSVDDEEEDEQEEEDIENVNFQVEINNYNEEDEDDYENDEEEEYVVEESSDEYDIEDAIGYCGEEVETEEQDDDEDSSVDDEKEDEEEQEDTFNQYEDVDDEYDYFDNNYDNVSYNNDESEDNDEEEDTFGANVKE